LGKGYAGTGFHRDAAGRQSVQVIAELDDKTPNPAIPDKEIGAVSQDKGRNSVFFCFLEEPLELVHAFRRHQQIGRAANVKGSILGHGDLFPIAIWEVFPYIG